MIEGGLIGRRVAAALIDGIVVFVLFALGGVVTGDADTSGSSASVELEGAATVVWALLGFGYNFATQARWGQTLDVLPFLYLIGFTIMITAGKGRPRLGDLAAGTAVVRG